MVFTKEKEKTPFKTNSKASVKEKSAHYIYFRKNSFIMRKKIRQTPQLFEKVLIINAGSEGMAIAKPEDKVVFVPFAAPGDIVDLHVIKPKKNYFKGKIIHFHSYSDMRTEPLCSHFGVCGGCKWQHLAYEHQLYYKQQQVEDNFDRIGKFKYPEIHPIIGSEKQYYYRNKLEFTFSPKKWFSDGKPSETLEKSDLKGLGFHLPGRFDRILDIDSCYLQEDLSNEIRKFIRDFAIDKKYSFYNVKTHEGLLRNIILRNTKSADWMLIVVIKNDDRSVRETLIPAVINRFPSIKSLFLIINPKTNDQLYDLPTELVYGEPFITETMKSPINGHPDLQFRIGPVSFFQTNAEQAEKLYQTAFQLAEFKGDEIVYDLYTGTGSIACYIAQAVKKVIGIDYVESAIKDAHINSALNGLANTEFIFGDIVTVFNQAFLDTYGKADIIITDPPRSGMHPTIVERLLESEVPKIVYISCNPATQARDIAILSEKYNVVCVQPLDMFPQTHHVENIVLLQLKQQNNFQE